MASSHENQQLGIGDWGDTFNLSPATIGRVDLGQLKRIGSTSAPITMSIISENGLVYQRDVCLDTKPGSTIPIANDPIGVAKALFGSIGNAFAAHERIESGIHILPAAHAEKMQKIREILGDSDSGRIAARAYEGVITAIHDELQRNFQIFQSPVGVVHAKTKSRETVDIGCPVSSVNSLDFARNAEMLTTEEYNWAREQAAKGSTLHTLMIHSPGIAPINGGGPFNKGDIDAHQIAAALSGVTVVKEAFACGDLTAIIPQTTSIIFDAPTCAGGVIPPNLFKIGQDIDLFALEAQAAHDFLVLNGYLPDTGRQPDNIKPIFVGESMGSRVTPLLCASFPDITGEHVITHPVGHGKPATLTDKLGKAVSATLAAVDFLSRGRGSKLLAQQMKRLGIVTDFNRQIGIKTLYRFLKTRDLVSNKPYTFKHKGISTKVHVGLRDGLTVPYLAQGMARLTDEVVRYPLRRMDNTFGGVKVILSDWKKIGVVAGGFLVDPLVGIFLTGGLLEQYHLQQERERRQSLQPFGEVAQQIVREVFDQPGTEVVFEDQGHISEVAPNVLMLEIRQALELQHIATGIDPSRELILTLGLKDADKPFLAIKKGQEPLGSL